mmetsp:Transcript_16158/g.61204  ORF Transcript_16158/g.61204 Transcript_16158/m.61204 type:complete len:266 (+) Transcript_16158:954-1751(+)
MASSCLSSATSRSRRAARAASSTSTPAPAAAALLLTRVMRWARLSVDTVSSRCLCSPHTQARRTVRLVPPSESLRTLVSVEERNGTCDRALLVRATTHCSRAESDWLMAIDSRCSVSSVRAPAAAALPSVFLMRSDPARSTRLRRERTARSAVPSLERCVTKSVNTQWLRLERRLRLCSAVVRRRSPWKSASRAASSDSTGSMVRPRTTVPITGSSATVSSPPLPTVGVFASASACAPALMPASPPVGPEGSGGTSDSRSRMRPL